MNLFPKTQSYYTSLLYEDDDLPGDTTFEILLKGDRLSENQKNILIWISDFVEVNRHRLTQNLVNYMRAEQGLSGEASLSEIVNTLLRTKLDPSVVEDTMNYLTANILEPFLRYVDTAGEEWTEEDAAAFNSLFISEEIDDKMYRDLMISLIQMIIYNINIPEFSEEDELTTRDQIQQRISGLGNQLGDQT